MNLSIFGIRNVPDPNGSSQIWLDLDWGRNLYNFYNLLPFPWDTGSYLVSVRSLLALTICGGENGYVT